MMSFAPLRLSASWLAGVGCILATTLFLSCGQKLVSDAPEQRGSLRIAQSLAPRLSDDYRRDRLCLARVGQILGQPAQEGTPEFDRNRAELLGRARGEPVVFSREPRRVEETGLRADVAAALRSLEKDRPGARMARVYDRFRHDPAALRSLVLREGYVYCPEPLDALALVRQARLAHLFRDPEIWLQRRTTTYRLTRVRRHRVDTYAYADGPDSGREAEVIFGDRVASSLAELDQPLHRDLRTLALEQGFDRTRLVHRGDDGWIAEVRFGDEWARVVLESQGAELRIACMAIDAEQRSRIELWRQENTNRLGAVRALENTITTQVREELRFDRPLEEETADLDGHLRPVWFEAYRQGRDYYSYDERSYAVYRDGKPWPPQVCVDFVLDTYERTSGTWFDGRARKPGQLDFNAHGIKNRRGVLAYREFALSKPDLFDVRDFEGRERIAFQHRKEFFASLLHNADMIRPGDVVAIRGVKRDGLIHQHAIFVENTDPLTGFPYALADQMKRPRRRTWEGIMAEAPLRSLLYRVRPKDAVFDAMAKGL